MKAFASLCLYLFVCTLFCKGQDSILLVGKITRKYTDKVEQKTQQVEQELDKQSEKLLIRLQKQQQKVYKALSQSDSNSAKTFLLNSQQQYEATLAKLRDKSGTRLKGVKDYVPGLDSASGVLRYLNKTFSAGSVQGGEKIADALAATSGAGHAVDQSAEIKKLVQQQQQQLKALATRYKDLNITKQLKIYNKEVYYYSQRIQQAKQTLNDPSTIEKEVLKLLSKNADFKNWMQQNGQLAQIFSASSSAGTAQNLAGLQTRQSVQQLVQSRLGGSLQQAQQAINGAVQNAQGQLNSVRNRLQQLGAGGIGNGGSDMSVPNFKPNHQKTKTFLQRLEYGVNLQSKGRSSWQPSTTDVGLSIGYKLNDKSVVGVGTSYKLGWGAPIKNIHFSHQGIGLRSYVDYKLKGSLWLSGGYEQNYNSSFRNFDILKNYSAWQHSGLVGLNKKIKQGKRTVETKLLWDFLSYRQVPRTQAILFRVEYKLK